MDVYNNSLSYRIVRIDLYEDQLTFWSNENLSPDQRFEVKRLTSQVGRLREMLGAILSLANELKASTVEQKTCYSLS